MFVCGSSSPISALGRAKACIGALVDGRLYLFDVGPGSWKNIETWRLPANRLSGVFLTHLHSDHIGDLAEANVQSWIWGRTRPLDVHGPEGVHDLVAGLNRAYSSDALIRHDQAGESLLPRDAAGMRSREIAVDSGRVPVLVRGDLTVEAFAVDHQLNLPALGYRIQYSDRVVVVSGDTVYSENLIEHAKGSDVLFHEAVSARLMGLFVAAAQRSRDERLKQFAPRFGEAHTTAREVVEIGKRTGAGTVVLYHLLPPPDVWIAKRMFGSGLPDNFIIAEDGLYFSLSPGSDDVVRGNL